jgi:hypothetical protein
MKEACWASATVQGNYSNSFKDMFLFPQMNMALFAPLQRGTKGHADIFEKSIRASVNCTDIAH